MKLKDQQEKLLLKRKWRSSYASKKAPIFVGGGVAHGPKGAVYKIKINKKVRKLALAQSLSKKHSDKVYIF